MAEQFVIEADATYDAEGISPLPRLIGPFPDRAAAGRYLDSLGPLWGEFDVAPIFPPVSTKGDEGRGGSKVDRILNDLDSGGDPEVLFSRRDGDFVTLHYEDGSIVIVQVRLMTTVKVSARLKGDE